ncbi:MAG: outer membrane protein transport protein [Capnocytophaga sp.]|nr:outer membrane protein transport protein [Capnocytophaga sp.]
MKKKLSISFLLITAIVSAQNVTDALRYSTDDLNGTARFKAMSGAFGALGGDFSAIGINPAGSSVFSRSEIGFTLGNESVRSKNTFANSSNKNTSSDFYINQFGLIFSIPTNDDNNSFSFAFNYSIPKNFDGKELSYSGLSDRNLGDYFAYFANGISQNNLIVNSRNNESVSSVYRYLGQEYGYRYQQAFLGYQSMLINPNSNSSSETGYTSNASSNSTLQNYDIRTEGEIRKYNFNFSGRIDNIYLGLNLNSHNVNYLETKYLTENNYSGGNVNYSRYQLETKTTGSGFSFQLGAIAKITEGLRLGVAYESPTWYNLQDETKEFLRTRINDNGVLRTYDTDPQYVNLYDEYKLRTPGSWTASVAYIFGKKALISLDYIYKGYQNMKFNTDFLNSQNEIISNELRDVNIIRFGGEYRIKAFSLRAGTRYEQSPYKRNVGDLNGYSLGVGYSFSGIRLDVSYDFAKQDYKYQSFESVLTTPVNVSARQNNILFTLSAKLF